MRRIAPTIPPIPPGGTISNTARIASIVIETVLDESPDLSWLTQDYNEPSVTPEEATLYRAQDAARLAEYEQGDWYMIGVRLAARVVIERPGRIDETLTLSTPGIWGVESDSDGDYLAEIARDEYGMLADDLRSLRFTDAEIREALDGDPDATATYAAMSVVDATI